MFDPSIHPDAFTTPDIDNGRAVIAYARDRMPDDGRPPHTHERGQLLHIVSGSMSVDTQSGTFVVPRERAVWIPANVLHSTRVHSRTEFRTIYVLPVAAPDLPDAPTVVHVSPLLRELILALMARPRDYDEEGSDGRLVAVLLDQIGISASAPMHLPMPSERRLRPIAELLRADPGDPRGVAEFAAMAAVSVRTFERRFQRETGLTVRAWRRQAKLLRALELLADHQPVTLVAEQLGYESPSAFIALFKDAFGVSPGRYFQG